MVENEKSATNRVGSYFGVIEPDPRGFWRWPFGEMKPADWFDVHFEARPIGAVRQLAYISGVRLGKKFSAVSKGDYTMVTCLDPADVSPAPRSSEAVLVGGDGDKYLGVLQPPAQGNWSWPFADMEPGQYFHVAHDDRPPERVRATAMMRGHQLSMPISVTANDHEKQGHAKVEYLAAPRGTALDTSNVDYQGLTALLLRYADVDPSEVNFWGSERTEYPIERIAETPKPEYFYKDFDGTKYRFEILEDRIVVTRTAQGTKPLKQIDEVKAGFGDDNSVPGIFQALNESTTQAKIDKAKIDLLD